jgi:hypothetical protein
VPSLPKTVVVVKHPERSREAVDNNKCEEQKKSGENVNHMRLGEDQG